jgi:hypothetical protein
MAAEKKSIKIGMVFLLVMLIFALIYSIVAFFSPAVFVSRSFSGATDQSWSDFVSSSPAVANYTLGLERTMAGFAFSVVIAGFFVLFTAFKRGEQWAWYYMLFVSLIAWLNNLRMAIATKSSLSLILNIVGLVLFIIGIVIPAKDFLGKQKTQ